MTGVAEVNKYTNGKIYRIWNMMNDRFYVGSTIQPLHKRMIGHRCDAGKQQCSKVKLYADMNTLGYEHFKIELIEYYPCNSRDELIRREGEIIRELKPELNMQIAGRTSKEWFMENKDILKEKQREYVAQNKTQIRQRRQEYAAKNAERICNYKKQWYEANKERIRTEFKKQYNENPEKHRERARQYHKDHPELMKLKNKEYYERNREKTIEQQKQYYLEKTEKKEGV